MEPGSQIKSLLQFHLASDPSSVKNLPFCLSTLTPECLRPSAHLAKWTNRIHSLIHSKDSGARWAGLSLAYKTSLLRRTIMIECSQSWVVVALPALSRNEPTPVLKAAVRLLRVIFTTATDISEFQRQVSVPNVVKFTAVLLSLADSHIDAELKIICMKTLTQLVELYPNIHRTSCANLAAFCLRHLSGSSPSRTNADIKCAVAELYAVLPLTGGKVGAINLWRKSLDETLAFGWDAYLSLRTTFPVQGQSIQPSLAGTDPQFIVPLNIDRLQCTVVTLRNLLCTITRRPVQVPLGNLVKFTSTLLSCSNGDKIDGFVDPLIRSMEEAVVPEIHSLGSELLVSLVERFPHCLHSYRTGLITTLVLKLEQETGIRLKVLAALEILLRNPYLLDSSVLTARIAKAILPSVTNVILNFSSTNSEPSDVPSSSKSRSGKKRTRNFDGEEVFSKRSHQVICPTSDEGNSFLVTLDILRHLFKNSSLSSALQSIIARVIIAMLVTFPRIPSSQASDPVFMLSLTNKVEEMSLLIGSGTTGAMCKALPYVIEASLSFQHSDLQRQLELLLHPRLPPILRSLPHLESLSLFKAEESHEEANIISSLTVKGAQPQEPEVIEEDVDMENPTLNDAPEEVAAQKQPTISQQQHKLNEMPSQYEPSNTVLRSEVEPAVSETAKSNSTAWFPSIENVTMEEAAPRPLATISKDVSRLPMPVEATYDDEDEVGNIPPINMSSDSENDDI